jgi:hypothetical protein
LASKTLVKSTFKSPEKVTGACGEVAQLASIIEFMLKQGHSLDQLKGHLKHGGTTDADLMEVDAATRKRNRAAIEKYENKITQETTQETKSPPKQPRDQALSSNDWWLCSLELQLCSLELQLCSLKLPPLCSLKKLPPLCSLEYKESMF